MSMRSTFAKGALAALAGVAAVTSAGAASAQSYGQYGYNSQYSGGYDPCQRSANSRGVASSAAANPVHAASPSSRAQ